MSTPVALKQTTLEPVCEHSTAAIRAAATWRMALRPLASLKLTVVLFAMAIFLVFASTLAQKELDVWDVIHGWYRVDANELFPTEAPWFNPTQLFVRVPVQIFFPDTFFPNPPQTSLGFWFPRG